MALYGNDIDETTTVLEADLGWILKIEKGDFLGRDVLVRQKAEGVTRLLVGFETEGRAIARHGHTAMWRGEPVGDGHQRHVRAVPQEEHRPRLSPDRAQAAGLAVRDRHPRDAWSPRSSCRRRSTRAPADGSRRFRCSPTTGATRRTTSGSRSKAASATIGITDFAQQELGDIVYVELPAIGRTVAQGEVLGTIESVKAVSELYAPVSGTITEVNTLLSRQAGDRERGRARHGLDLQADARPKPAELDALMDAAAYCHRVASALASSSRTPRRPGTRTSGCGRRTRCRCGPPRARTCGLASRPTGTRRARCEYGRSHAIGGDRLGGVRRHLQEVHRAIRAPLFDLADLVADRDHRVAEPVELFLRFALGRLDHERAGHRETTSSARGSRSP